jgi:diketogulonate reductase-like aldo/keto reductase
VAHLEGLKSAGLPTPSVNQIEIHLYHRNDELVKYCREHDITVMGYSPLARNMDTTDPDLVAVAKRHNKSFAQVMIRWSVQHGHITIPKSTNFQRIAENAAVFDFNLSDADLKSLSGKRDFVCGWNPTISPWEG